MLGLNLITSFVLITYTPYCDQHGQPVVIPPIDTERDVRLHQKAPQISDSIQRGVADELKFLYQKAQKASFDFAAGRQRATSAAIIQMADEVLPPTAEQISSNAPHSERPSYYIRNFLISPVQDAEYGHRFIADVDALKTSIIPDLKTELEKLTGAKVDVETSKQDNLGLSIQMDELREYLSDNPKIAKSMKDKTLVFKLEPKSSPKIKSDSKTVEVRYDTENLDQMVRDLTSARIDHQKHTISQSNIRLRGGVEGELQVMEYVEKFITGEPGTKQHPLISTSGSGVMVDLKSKEKEGGYRLGQKILTRDLLEKALK